jgi:uncharacterized protein (DUF1778 family)
MKSKQREEDAIMKTDTKSAPEKEQTMLKHENKIRLNKQSAEDLFELIENSPKANPKLAQAMKQYKESLQRNSYA